MQTTMPQDVPIWRRLTNVLPPARWPLLLGGLLTVSLPFLPWLTVQLWVGPVFDLSHPGTPGPSEGINPLRFFLTHQPLAHATLLHFASLLNIALLALAIPVLLGAAWLLGPIHTRVQRYVVVLLSVWTFGFIGLGFYAAQWTVTNYSEFYMNFGGETIISDAVGKSVFYLTALLLVVGLALLWYEVWQRQRTIMALANQTERVS